jgi:branched-chain amino acid transport system substrate-binding protein
LGACGSGSSSSTIAGSSPSSAASRGKPTGGSITIGTICSCSGLQAGQLGALGKVAQVWASNVNASGGINGHPVHLIVKDDGSNPATSLQAASSSSSRIT